MRAPAPRKAPTAVVIALLVLSVPMGCKTTTSDKNLRFVPPDEAEKLVVDKKSLLGLNDSVGAWVDPRDKVSFKEGHIAGAIHLQLDTVRRDHHLLDSYRTLVVYGDDYNSPLARAMSKTLIELGHGNVYTLRGGLRGWTEAGNRLEKDAE